MPASRVIHLAGASTGVTGNRPPARRPAYWYQARRRFFLKNYGACYTALADAAFIMGFAAWRVRRRLQRKPDSDPPYMLIDSIRHSVFCAGISVPVVENPAMRQAGGVPEPPLDVDSRSASHKLKSKTFVARRIAHTTVSW